MEFRLLGPLEVVDDDGTPVDLPGAKLRRLLLLLAMNAGGVTSSDHLIDALYGEELPRQPGNALHLLVARLRRCLADAEPGADRLVVTHPTGYALAVDGDRLDARRFERMVADGRRRLEAGDPAGAAETLTAALGLWRGDALADAAYADSVAGERARLEEMRLGAVEDRMEADLGQGRHAEVVAELESLTAAHPLRERIWGQLMVALYRCGRQADALRAFQEARRHLADELGIDPGPELRRLEDAVLAQDPALASPARAAPPPTPLRGNLPEPITDLVGRKEDLAHVRVLLETHRLVTLVGPGGAGKTRLAIEVGRAVAPLVSDGVWFVELAPIDRDIATAVARVLGVDDSDGTDPTTRVVRALRDRDAVLVVDNCEHVVDESARVVRELLSRCAGVRVLATSREPLGLVGEHRFAVPPLDLDASVELFAERAVAAGAPPLLAGARLREAAMSICERLEGLPLALELAASKAAHLDLQQIAARLEDRFSLLTGGPRTADARQRTLQAVVDWSWELLGEDERLVFERFSVFAGSASLEASEAVCAGGPVQRHDVAEVLGRLVDKSLVVVDRSAVEVRYRMLQTLAEYAAARLAERGEDEAARIRHARWARDLVAAADRRLRGPGQLQLVGRLAAEIHNVRAAADWALLHDPELALELAADVGWFCYMTDQAETGWRLLTAALAVAPDAPALVRARALAYARVVGLESGQGATVDRLGADAMALARTEGDPAFVAEITAIGFLADVHTGMVDRIEPVLDETSEAFAAAGDAWGVAFLRICRGIVMLHVGDFDGARLHMEEGLAGLEAVGDDWNAAVTWMALSYLAERQGRHDEAAAALEESLRRGLPFQEAVATTPVRLPNILAAEARLALARAAQGRFEEALELAEGSAERCRCGMQPAVGVAHHARGQALIGLGRAGEGRRDLVRAAEVFATLEIPVAAAEALWQVGRSLLAEGDADAARTQLTAALTHARRTGDVTITDGILASLSEAGAATRHQAWPETDRA